MTLSQTPRLEWVVKREETYQVSPVGFRVDVAYGSRTALAASSAVRVFPARELRGPLPWTLPSLISLTPPCLQVRSEAITVT